MPSSNSVVYRELAVVAKIIRDEAWLEGERRGCYVPPTDPVVRARACDVVLRIGRELREKYEAEIQSERQLFQMAA